MTLNLFPTTTDRFRNKTRHELLVFSSRAFCQIKLRLCISSCLSAYLFIHLSVYLDQLFVLFREATRLTLLGRLWTNAHNNS